MLRDDVRHAIPASALSYFVAIVWFGP
jgi:hypothetical protein